LLGEIDEAALLTAEKQAQRKANLLAIASSPSRLISPETLMGSLHEATEGLSLDQAGQTIFQIARQHVENGRWELACNLYQELLENQPQHPLALEAYRWLIAYYASGEACLRMAKPAIFQTQEAKFDRTEDGQTTIQTTGREGVVQNHEFRQDACGRSILLGSHLYVASPHLWSDPRIQLCLYSAYRRIGNTKVIDSHWHAIVDANPKTRWAAAIGLEKWLLAPTDLPPRSLAESHYVPEKPYLDGQLQDAAWKRQKGTTLSSGKEAEDRPYETEVTVCHDAEYLYIAARCNVPSGVEIPEAVKRTEHDADVSGHDRIEICLDIDRDYTSFYRLAVDHRGLAAADCWGDRTWNPRWFVARSADETGWQVEAAIPLAEIADATDLTNEIWAFNVVRIVPDHGVQAMSLPAAEEARPEGFTLIRFLNSSEQRLGPLQAN
jgi:hypothetical protein